MNQQGAQEPTETSRCQAQPMYAPHPACVPKQGAQEAGDGTLCLQRDHEREANHGCAGNQTELKVRAPLRKPIPVPGTLGVWRRNQYQQHPKHQKTPHPKTQDGNVRRNRERNHPRPQSENGIPVHCLYVTPLCAHAHLRTWLHGQADGAIQPAGENRKHNVEA
jgi:hypothetical protein